jgi:hypothetical protein
MDFVQVGSDTELSYGGSLTSTPTKTLYIIAAKAFRP